MKHFLRDFLVLALVALALPVCADAQEDMVPKILHSKGPTVECFKIETNTVALGKDFKDLKEDLIKENRLRDAVTQIFEADGKCLQTVYLFASENELAEGEVASESIIYTTDNQEWYKETEASLTVGTDHPYMVKEFHNEYPDGKVLYSATFQRDIVKETKSLAKNTEKVEMTEEKQEKAS